MRFIDLHYPLYKALVGFGQLFLMKKPESCGYRRARLQDVVSIDTTLSRDQIKKVFAMGFGLLHDLEPRVCFFEVPGVHRNQKIQGGVGLRFIIIYRMSEEQQKIQKYIIKSTPYGELPDALKDLQKLAPLDPTAPLISNSLQEYNEEHLALFPLQPGAPAHYPIMSVCRVGPSRYIDQHSKKIYTVDHLKGEIVATEDTTVELIESVQELLNLLSTAAEKYTATYYKQPCASTVFMNLSEDSLDVHVGITSKNVQLNNFVTGEWISRWIVRKGEIQGTVSINSHFFESGNVQFHQKKTFKKEFQFEQSMTENAKNIMKVIEQSEGQIQSNLNELYEEMPSNFFKHLRRITPLTKTKMVWNINAIKMNRNLLGLKK